jgi:hypothetical protein
VREATCADARRLRSRCYVDAHQTENDFGLANACTARQTRSARSRLLSAVLDSLLQQVRWCWRGMRAHLARQVPCRATASACAGPATTAAGP